jgi:predicted nuclease of predicted toxin-antitoxin system
MRLLADLHISPRTVEYLQSRGHDVVRVSQVLPPTSSDHQIIAYAVKATGQFSGRVRTRSVDA